VSTEALARDRTVEVRELDGMPECIDAAKLLSRIWGEDRIVTPALLRALHSHGSPVLGAFDEQGLVGAQMGFFGLEEGELFLHSHMTGVDPEAQHRGVGLLLKIAQRAWCLARDVGVVTWTFDPLVGRNAHFNLRKLGAFAPRFHRDFYGRMRDAFNVGDRSDRLEVRWELRAPRVESALAGRPTEVPVEGAGMLLDATPEGLPLARPGAEGRRLLVRIPEDYHALRSADPEAGSAWRDASGDALEEAAGRGYRAVDFRREGIYVLELDG
jgi:predicted GNAT superfamily acetyltransferase